MSMNSRTLTTLGVAVTLLLILPLSIPGGFFILPKLAVTGLWLVLLGAFIFLNRQAYRLALPRPLLWLLVAYLSWITLSNLGLSPYRHFTLIGWPNWYSGLSLTLLLAGVFMVSGVVQRHTTISLRTPLTILCGLSLIVCAVSVAERLGFNPIIGSSWFVIPDLPKDFNPGSPLATVGNPGWLAGLWLLMLPLPFIKATPVRLVFPWILVNAVGLATTSNKTSLYLGVATMLILFLLTRFKTSPLAGRILIAATILMLSASTGMTTLNKVFYERGLVSRMATIASVDASAGSSSLKGRILIWKSALRLTVKRPLTGWGLDTLQMNFFEGMPSNDYRQLIEPVVNPRPGETVRHEGFLHMVIQPDGAVRKMQFFLMVRPHNALIEEVYSHGILGLTLLLALLGYSGWTVLRHGSPTEHILLLACGLYGIYLLVWFTTVAITPLAALLLGTAVASSHQRQQARHSTQV